MSETYKSTMALSVYNVLSLTKTDLPRETIDCFLRSSGALGPNIDDGYTDDGIAYLLAEGLAREEEGKVVIDRLPTGTGKPVVRTNEDRELARAAY